MKLLRVLQEREFARLGSNVARCMLQRAAHHFVTKLGSDTGNRVESITAGTRLDAAADIKLEMAVRSRAQADHFLPDGMTLDQYEQDIIREALRRADGDKSQAARLLGLTRNALRYRLTQMGLES